MDELESAVRREIAASGAVRTAVVAGAVGGPRAVLVDADEPFYAASTMKVPVLVELYRRAWAGAASLDDVLPVRNAFRSVLDGSPYALDPADDSETALYTREGQTETLRKLARLMIVVSSNLATNLLIDWLGAPAVEATLRALGVEGVHVVRGVEDKRAHAAGRNNTVTAAGLATLLERIAAGSAAPPDACAAMLDVLAAQAFNEGIPAGLPPGTRVAHKTGWYNPVYHDAAVVYPTDGQPYVLVILTEGLDEATTGPALMARISRVVYDSFAGPAA
jgi:beta-lactamase class A